MGRVRRADVRSPAALESVVRSAAEPMIANRMQLAPAPKHAARR